MKEPKIPDWENNIYNINPTTTGGKLISVLIAKIKTSLPLKLFKTMKHETSREKNVAHVIAHSETIKERDTME